MAADAVFGDTSFFFALAARRDHAHPRAVRVLNSLLDEGRTIITTDYVMDEVLTLTKLKTDAATAIGLYDRIERSDSIAIESIDAARFRAAWTMFRKHADHAYSFTDCSSFVVMRELALKEALTTDAHFKEAGFKSLL